jgi:hypothetical protein
MHGQQNIKCISDKRSQEEKEQWKEGKPTVCTGHTLWRNCLLKQVTDRKDRREGKTKAKTLATCR